jgi:hypothetical protein
MDLLYWSRHFRNMPGEGDLDVSSVVRAVMATGSDGPISLEIFNDQFRAGRPRLVAQDGHRSLIALMVSVWRAEPTLTVDLPAFPAAPVQRIQFQEFATTSDDVPAWSPCWRKTTPSPPAWGGWTSPPSGAWAAVSSASWIRVPILAASRMSISAPRPWGRGTG